MNRATTITIGLTGLAVVGLSGCANNVADDGAFGHGKTLLAVPSREQLVRVLQVARAFCGREPCFRAGVAQLQLCGRDRRAAPSRAAPSGASIT